MIVSVYRNSVSNEIVLFPKDFSIDSGYNFLFYSELKVIENLDEEIKVKTQPTYDDILKAKQIIYNNKIVKSRYEKEEAEFNLYLLMKSNIISNKNGILVLED
jgi:hypothetical protein